MAAEKFRGNPSSSPGKFANRMSGTIGYSVVFSSLIIYLLSTRQVPNFCHKCKILVTLFEYQESIHTLM